MSVTPALSAAAPKFKPMAHVGFVDSAAVPGHPYDINGEQSTDVVRAQNVIKRAKEAGANTLKIIKEWNTEGNPSQQELDAVCVTARAMAASGMKTLVITLMPTRYSWPTTEQSLKLFSQTIEGYNAAFFGQHGCVSKLQMEVMWQPGNEPNIATFCRTGNDAIDDDENARHAGCARQFVYLQQSVYRTVQEQEKFYGVNMPVLGAGLGSHHSPISFLHHVNNAMQFYNYRHSGMDLFAFHPYALRGSNKPDSGLLLTPKVMSVVRKVLGRNMQFIYDETGYETVTPIEKRDPSCTTPPSVMLIPETHYASWVQLSLKLSKAQGAVGYLNFLVEDERCENPGWQSGLYYWDGTPKPFLPGVTKLFRSYTQPAAKSRSVATRKTKVPRAQKARGTPPQNL